MPKVQNPELLPMKDDELLSKLFDQCLDKGVKKQMRVLRNHKITSNHRAQMIDWMIQVLAILEESP